MGTVRHERIVSDPAIMTGKPVIKGTRVTVALVQKGALTVPSCLAAERWWDPVRWVIEEEGWRFEALVSAEQSLLSQPMVASQPHRPVRSAP
jgi:hypothetical protein